MIEVMAKTHKKKNILMFLRAKETVMMALALVSIAVVVLEHLEHLSTEQLLIADVLEIGISVLFLTDFFFEYHHARNRKQYLRHNWPFLLAAVPVPTQIFDALKGIRLLRLLKLSKAFAHIDYERNTRLLR